ncbi:MAG: hypothetical protein NTX42_07815 [Methanothrix sp.]|nr:hypothetical protein [Methanothrix sp.]
MFVILPTKKALQISPLHIPHKCHKHLQDFRGNLQGNFLGDFRGNFRGDFRSKKCQSYTCLRFVVLAIPQFVGGA